MRLMVASSAAWSRISCSRSLMTTVGAGVVERDGGIGGKVFEQVEVLLGVGILLEALNAEHAKDAILRDERKVDHRGGRLGGAAVFEREIPVLVGRNIFLVFRRDVVDETGLRLSIHQTAKLILVVCSRVYGA